MYISVYMYKICTIIESFCDSKAINKNPSKHLVLKGFSFFDDFILPTYCRHFLYSSLITRQNLYHI